MPVGCRDGLLPTDETIRALTDSPTNAEHDEFVTQYLDKMGFAYLHVLPNLTFKLRQVHVYWRRYHQYKFIVDGEWRHDESQAYMPDPLGNVNNWLFVRKPEPQGAQQPQSHLPLPGYATILTAAFLPRWQR